MASKENESMIITPDIVEVFEEGIGTESRTEDTCGDKRFNLDIVRKANLALGCSRFSSAGGLGELITALLLPLSLSLRAFL